MASGDTHERRCLVQGHVLSEQTVQNLESCLFFLSQCHTPLMENVTFMLYDQLAPVYGWFTEGFDTADLQEAKVLSE